MNPALERELFAECMDKFTEMGKITIMDDKMREILSKCGLPQNFELEERSTGVVSKCGNFKMTITFDDRYITIETFVFRCGTFRKKEVSKYDYIIKKPQGYCNSRHIELFHTILMNLEMNVFSLNVCKLDDSMLPMYYYNKIYGP